ncbi:hypothetical protein M3204_01905 [Mesobacillus subterraneus]|nr:hypothetical protein [Mesobacillus subterraneus]
MRNTISNNNYKPGKNGCQVSLSTKGIQNGLIPNPFLDFIGFFMGKIDSLSYTFRPLLDFSMSKAGKVSIACITIFSAPKGCPKHAIGLFFENRLWYSSTLSLDALLIGVEGAKTPAGAWVRGDPTGACAEEAPRATRGKRSAWNGNQQDNLRRK